MSPLSVAGQTGLLGSSYPSLSLSQTSLSLTPQTGLSLTPQTGLSLTPQTGLPGTSLTTGLSPVLSRTNLTPGIQGQIHNLVLPEQTIATQASHVSGIKNFC